MASSAALSPFQLLAAYALDLCIGDPRGLPHPVRMMGRYIRAAEPRLRRCFPETIWGERIAGGTLAASLSVASWTIAHLGTVAAHFISPVLGGACNIISAASTIATRDLLNEARAVERALLADDLALARERVARIVGRDTDSLDASGVARAVIETLAESLCDGIAAPLLALAVAGVPGAFAFKAISTLDSMIGHREKPYTHFGTFAARTDDVANYYPARIAAATLCALAPMANQSLMHAMRIVLRDASKHKSPNAGFPEAAMAGLLNIRLGGPLSYDGAATETPLLNAEARAPQAEDITDAIRFTAMASGVLAIEAVLIRYLQQHLFDENDEYANGG